MFNADYATESAIIDDWTVGSLEWFANLNNDTPACGDTITKMNERSFGVNLWALVDATQNDVSPYGLVPSADLVYRFPRLFPKALDSITSGRIYP